MLTLFFFLSCTRAAVVSLNGTAGLSSSSTDPAISTPPTATSSATSDPCLIGGFFGQNAKTILSMARGSTTLFQLGGIEFMNPYSATEVEPNASLQTFCASAFESSLTRWLGTVPVTAGYAWGPLTTTEIYEEYTSTAYYAACASGTDDYTSLPWTLVYPGVTTTQTFSGHTDNIVASPFSFTASPPCCGQCHITGGEVQVYFWPSTTASPPISTLTDLAGFEFTSPSIYVAFKSLYASDLCGSMKPEDIATTIAFGVDELSTAVGFTWDTSVYAAYPPYFGSTRVFTAATWGNVLCSDIVESFWQYGILNIGNYFTDTYRDLAAVSTHLGENAFNQYLSMSWIHQFTVTHNPCSPTLSVPTQLYTINSVWSSCGNDLKGLFDPPYTLTPGTGLKSISVTAVAPVEPVTSLKSISPAATPAPATPTMTSTPNPTADSPAVSRTIQAIDPPMEIPTTSTEQTVVYDPSPTFMNDPTTVNENATPKSQTPAHPNVDTGTGDVTAIIIGTQTVSPGGSAILISGTTISVAPDSDFIVVDGSTKSLGAIMSSTTAYMIASKTLIPGGDAITLSGTLVSLQVGGSSVVVGGSTEALSSFLGSSTSSTFIGGIGGIIATIVGLGGPAPAESYVPVSGNGSYDGLEFLGGAQRCTGIAGFWRWLLTIGVWWFIY